MAIINGNFFPNILIGTNLADTISGFRRRHGYGSIGNDFARRRRYDSLIGGLGNDC